MTEAVGVGFLGFGTVGSAAARILAEDADGIAARSGVRLEVRAIAVRDPERPHAVAPVPLIASPSDVVADPRVDVVVEVMGGVDPAREHVLAAVRAGKHVVTANKELLAAHGAELFRAAEERGVELAFEAAVGGGIPLVRPLLASLAGERVTRVMGIVNGTTNYVLTRMTEDGLDAEAALAEAKARGFAEADPSADVEGHDAASKCAILATVAFGTSVVTADVAREGIGRVTPEDIAFAARLGHVVKLLAVAELEQGEVAARVHPTMIPRDHPLASVRESFNAVFVEGERTGELMFYGRGAGGDPTATAVVGDLVHVARAARAGGPPLLPSAERRLAIRSPETMEGQYYLLLDVADRPGVLAQVAGAFAEHEVSIKSVWQEGFGDEALLVLITHRANEGALRATVATLDRLESVAEVRSVMRVEGVT